MLQRVSATPEVAAEFVGMLGGIDVRARLAQVPTRTLVLHSRDDAWVPMELGREIAAALPDARFVSFASSSHLMLPREPAWEDFVATVLAFTRAGTAGTSGFSE